MPGFLNRWVATVLFVSAGWAATADAADSRKIERLIEDGQTPEDRARLVEQRKAIESRGRELFLQYCLPCHGPRGQGKGPASYFLFPKPRDLGAGIFKFHTTQANALPRDSDLLLTLREGIPGTAMPGWGEVLPEEDLRALVQYIKTLSPRFQREIPDYEVDFGLEPPFDRLSVDKGRDIYRQLRCARCHGEQGKRTGVLEERLKDVWGHPSFVFDLTRPELYKRGTGGDALYNTLAVGIDGTPMSAYDYLDPAETWHLIHFLQSRFEPPEAPAPPPRSRIARVVARRVEGEFPKHPDHPAWARVSPVRIPLLPVQERRNPILWVEVKALHDGRSLALRLEWPDPSPETPASSPERFLDGAALQFPVETGEAGHNTPWPFFGMGERRRRVNIWHWKADAAAGGTGSPPASAREIPRVQPFLETSVEELNARGFGALSVQTLEDQQVEAEGSWREGRWRLVFNRPLTTPSPNDAQFAPGEVLPLAVAIWDGANRDKNANKVVSFWQELKLQ